MFGRLPAILLYWPLPLSLATLVTNDVFLKPAFPGLLSGKLSDFAGIFLVAYLAFALFPRARLAASIGIVALFSYWKSPFSEPLIDMVNALVPVTLGRVVDYWDLLAFTTIPIALLFANRLADNRPATRMQKMVALPIGGMVLTAIMGTSVMTPVDAFNFRSADPSYAMDADRVAAAVDRIATRYELECLECEPGATAAEYRSRDIWLLYEIDETDNAVVFFVEVSRQKGVILTKPDTELLERVRNDLKQEFATMGSNMQYFEGLNTDPREQRNTYLSERCNEDAPCQQN